MNDDSDALQRNLLELLQDLVLFTTSDDSEVVNPVIDGSDGQSGASVMSAPDLLISQDAPSVDSSQFKFDASSQRKNLLKLGETPAVQDRFHTLLKHRLQSEIQQNLPLFPWETEVHDYETESTVGFVDSAVLAAPPAAVNQSIPAQVWLHQLKTLNLPVALPDRLLGQLLERCQNVVQSSLLEGAKLVKSVEDLFPGQSQSLNQLAGMVMTSPARSGAMPPPSGANYPTNYESAVPAQQMVLSLLAAREIIAALTLTVSLRQPTLERQWLTELGALSLQVDYGLDATAAKLRIQGTLPCGGTLTLRSEHLEASAQRATAGVLSVELFDLAPHQSGVLEVCLPEQKPLVFAVRITD
ncbi:PatU [Phormidium sp. FACHB-592]|uniref:PatU n=1 Tax=Stenomitos frigidus AS-A4 TaxID=2933935 RepID=A0ABV0KCC2_9CYAN|nr:PatU [Phormidium sp. FACHB-592]MBD2077510.1 PatU [Phormidium sp. FACHB-592]